VDETSLLVKKVHRPAVVWKEGQMYPLVAPKPQIFSCTCLFIVDAQGGSVESTLIISSKYDLKCLTGHVFPHMEVRFE
jgi:hypothetical protein